MFARLLNDLYHDHLACPCIHRFFFGDQNILADTLVLRLHVQNSVIRMQSPHQMGYSTFQHFYDDPFPAASPVNPDFTHHHAVAVQRFAHFFGA
jgi:hypothetical protein